MNTRRRGARPGAGHPSPWLGPAPEANAWERTRTGRPLRRGSTPEGRSGEGSSIAPPSEERRRQSAVTAPRRSPSRSGVAPLRFHTPTAPPHRVVRAGDRAAAGPARRAPGRAWVHPVREHLRVTAAPVSTGRGLPSEGRHLSTAAGPSWSQRPWRRTKSCRRAAAMPRWTPGASANAPSTVPIGSAGATSTGRCCVPLQHPRPHGSAGYGRPCRPRPAPAVSPCPAPR